VGVEALDRLDRLAAERGLSRSQATRLLIEEATIATGPASLGEALSLLSAKARAGDTRAQVALVRTLSDREPQRDRVQRKRDELAARRRARSGGD
jgi:hypothetical protein